MIETLESKVPPEVASIMFRFLKHPTAELLEPLIMTYDYRSMHWATLCKSNQQMHLAPKFVFSPKCLYRYTDNKREEARQTTQREILLG